MTTNTPSDKKMRPLAMFIYLFLFLQCIASIFFVILMILTESFPIMVEYEPWERFPWQLLPLIILGMTSTFLLAYICRLPSQNTYLSAAIWSAAVSNALIGSSPILLLLLHAPESMELIFYALLLALPNIAVLLVSLSRRLHAFTFGSQRPT